MTALVWLACTGPPAAKPDSDDTGCVPAEETCDGIDNNCDGAVDEAGCDSTVTPPACDPFDLCGDGEDGDCDGEVDEVGCVTAWSATPDSRASNSFATTAGRIGIDTTVDNIRTVQALEVSNGGFAEGWSTVGHSAWAGSGATASSLVVAVGLRVEVWEDPGPTAGSPTLISSLSYGEGWTVKSASLVSPTSLLSSRFGEVTLTSSVPPGESDIEPLVSARFVSADFYENGLGNEAAWINDPLGDGTPGVLVGGAFSGYEYEAAMYLFDATAQGTVDAADGHIALNLDGSGGLNLRPVGDVTGDGYEDLIMDVSSGGIDGLVPGPFSTTRDTTSAPILFGWLSVVPSVDGDESPDIVSLWSDGPALFYASPLSGTAYGEEEAYASVDFTHVPMRGWVPPCVADVDQDGASELFLAGSDGDFDYLALLPLVLP